MTTLIGLFVGLFALLITSAYTDLAHGKIYDRVTYPAIAIGLTLNFLIGGIAGPGNFNLIAAVLGFLLGLLGLGVFYVSGAMGGGDVKLAAAIGAFIGYRYLLWALFYSSLVGGIMALALVIWKGRLLDSLRGSFRFLITLRTPLSGTSEEPLTIPFGLALVLGTYWCWFMRLNDPEFFPFLPAA
jgi:prepilin peptidase CpaA